MVGHVLGELLQVDGLIDGGARPPKAVPSLARVFDLIKFVV